MVTIRKWVVYDIVLPTLRVYRKFLFLSQETLNSTCTWLGVTPIPSTLRCTKRLAWPWGGGHHDCWLRPHPNENQRALSVDQPTMYLDLCWTEAVWMVWPPLLRDYLIYALIPWCCSFITSCYHSHYHINMHRHTHLHIYIFTGWWFGTFVFLHILGMSSSQLTNIVQRGWNHQPDTHTHIYIYI